MNNIKNKKIIIGFAIMLVIIFVFAMIFLSILANNEEEINPFNYVDVRFSGLSGSGRADIEIVLNDKGIDDHNLFLNVSKDVALKEGDEVTITATSYSFRLTESTKTYVVNGLDFYISDLESISSKGLNSIHEQTRAINDNNIKSFKLTDNIISRECVKMYLVLDEDGKNSVYDVEKIKFALNEKTYTYYLVAYYRNLLLRKDEEASIAFEGARFIGESISIPTGAIIGFESIDEVKDYIIKITEKDTKLLER